MSTRAVRFTWLYPLAALVVPCLPASAAFAASGTLTIGAVIPLTGTYGSYGAGLAAGMNIAVKDVNAAGGVLGKPIDLVVEDSQSDPTAALNAAKKLIDVDKVDAIVGTFSSSETLPILSFTTQAKIPVLTVSGAPEISDIGKKTGMIYRFVVTEGIFGEAYAVYARKAGYSKAYVLASDNAAERDAAKKFTARFKKEGGDVLGTTIFEPNQSNYNSEVSAALAGNPDVIVVAAYTNDAITIAKTVHQLDPDVKIIGPLYSLGNDFLKAVGPQVAEGTLSIDAMPAESSAAYAGFAPLYKAATGDEPTANPYAVMDYDMIITLSLAADAAKSTDPAKFVPFIRMVANPPGLVVSSYTAGLEALKEGKKIDYNGASSPVDFDDSGDLKSMFLRTFKIESGKIVATGSIAP